MSVMDSNIRSTVSC